MDKVKVYIVDRDFKADHKVFLVDRDSQQKNHQLISPGLLVDRDFKADKKVFIVDRDFKADIKITKKNFPTNR